jgi:hypothetical protein
MSVNIKNYLKTTNVADFNNFCDNLVWKIGFLGGRRLVDKTGSYKGSLCLNDLIRHLDTQSSQVNPPGEIGQSTSVSYRNLADKVIVLHRDGQQAVTHVNIIKRVFTRMKSFLSSKFYDRDGVLARMRNQPIASSPFELPALQPKSKLQTEVEKPIIPPLSQNTKLFLRKNPWIHGTSSVIFEHLPHTEQKLLSLHDLLLKKMAPIGGEIFGGGTNCLLADGNTSFGQLKGTKYDLERVLNYAQSPGTSVLSNTQEVKDQLKVEFLHALDCLMLTQALILATRARQRGFSVTENSNNPEKIELRQQLKNLHINIVNSYSLIPFLAKFVRKNDSSSESPQSFIKSIEEFLKTHMIDLSMVAFEQSLNMTDPSMAKIQEFLNEKGYSLHEVIQTPQSTSGLWRSRIRILDAIHLSIFEYGNHTNLQLGSLNEHHQELLVANNDLFTQIYTPFFKNLSDHFALLDDMLFSEIDMTRPVPSENKALIEKPFGIILMSADERCFEFKKTEYRSVQPLTLGKEIEVIATAAENIPQVKAYLDRYSIQGVEVIAFEALQQRGGYGPLKTGSKARRAGHVTAQVVVSACERRPGSGDK